VLVHQYELFKMIPSDFITSIFTRKTTITNCLDAIERIYTNAEIVRKNFRSLLKTRKAKVMVIQETKNLTKLSLEELISSLMTHEITMKKQRRIWHSMYSSC